MKKKFEGKVAIVTGAASGIGAATAIAFAQEGARVVVADVNDCAETVNAIEAFGGEVFFVQCDVSDEAQVKAMVQQTVLRYGQLDIAFNNAGIEGIPGDTVSCTADNWNRVININLKGAWLCMKYEIPEMLKTGNASIVNCSSIAGLVGFANMPAYVASKHGLVGLTKTAALEYAKQGIRVNAVCPGVIQTPMIVRFTGGDAAAVANLAAAEPVGRVGRPEEIADAVLWLCADGASFVTGQAIAVDGGWVAQ